jgi:hypothetical protein
VDAAIPKPSRAMPERNTSHRIASRLAPGRAYLAACRVLIRDLFDPYRPELHYMRGPGPKWRAKHSQAHTLARHINGELARATA